MPSTPPSRTSHPYPALAPDPGPAPAPPARRVLAARLAVVLAAASGMAGLTVATAGAVGPRATAFRLTARAVPAAAARVQSSRVHVGSVPPGSVHIESVSTPVLVTASELAQAEASTNGPASTNAPASTNGPAAAPAASTTAASSGGGGTDMGTFLVTCYDIRGRTATGDQAGPESVAVDPSVIPLGSEIYIDGVGTRRADDTGGGVHGHHIDIWASSYSACAAFGRQYRDVHRMS